MRQPGNAHQPTRVQRALIECDIVAGRELDIRSMPALEDHIVAHWTSGADEIQLDFSAITFVGARETARLAQLARWLDDRGVQLHIARPSDRVRRLFALMESAGLDAGIARWIGPRDILSPPGEGASSGLG